MNIYIFKKQSQCAVYKNYCLQDLEKKPRLAGIATFRVFLVELCQKGPRSCDWSYIKQENASTF